MATRDRLEAFVLSGRNLVAMAGNTGYWQIRYEPSHVGLPDPVVVGYKESATDQRTPAAVCRRDVVVPRKATNCADPWASDSDPRNDRYVTTRFREQPVNRPEQALFGVQFQLFPASVGWELPVTLFTNRIAASPALGRRMVGEGRIELGAIYQPTGLATSQIFRWEGDTIHPELLLRSGPGSCLVAIGASRWTVPLPGQPDNHVVHLVLHRPTASAGAVVAGLTMLWSWGLDDWAARRSLPLSGPPISRVDPRLQQLTRNMLSAAETGSLPHDCGRHHGLDLFIASIGRAGSVQLILKERAFPGRWAAVPIGQDADGLALQPRVNGLARLSGWPVGGGAHELFVADVSGDGRADLVAREKRRPGNWYVATSNGTTFAPQPVALRGWPVGGGAHELFVADVSGDGRADLVAREKRRPGNWYVATSNGTTFAPQPVALRGWPVGGGAHELFVADVSGDGRADLVAREKRRPGNWYVATSNGTTFAPQPVALRGWPVGGGAHELFVADVSGDGSRRSRCEGEAPARQLVRGDQQRHDVCSAAGGVAGLAGRGWRARVVCRGRER